MGHQRCAVGAGVGGLGDRMLAGQRSHAMREGRLSLDQVGVIAGRAGVGSNEHYAELAKVASVNQLRTAVKLEP